MRRFSSFACFDWSGQAVPRPRGIALAIARADEPPALLTQHKGWSRHAALDWLSDQAAKGSDMLIGMDLSAGFPFADHGAFFPGWNESPPHAAALWAMVDAICASDDHLGAGSFVNHTQARRYFRHTGLLGDRYGPHRAGRLRVVEQESQRQGIANPYSCLNLVGAAQVGKSSLTGMRLLHRLGGSIPVWPFDPVPTHGPMIVEIYTSLAAVAAGLPRGRTKMRTWDSFAQAIGTLGSRVPDLPDLPDDHGCDALLTAAWLRRASADAALWTPAALTAKIAQTEGWTFGVG